MADAPKQLGQYKIIRQIGAGGMADVYEALDEKLQRHIALKLLPIEFSRDKERVTRFDREVLATAKLNHPNIVTVYDVGSEEGYAFYTMELLLGGSLKQKINEGMSQEAVLVIAKEVASALAYAHEQGFVHRDLKPDNILFDSYGKAIVTDLGIAKIMGKDTTALGMSLGTPYYMSPEQALAKTIDGRSDLYSLGVLIYRMLTGLPLFDAEDSQAICLKHVQEPPPRLPALHDNFQPILDKLLAKQPTDRYDDAHQLLAALERVQVRDDEATLVMGKPDEVTHNTENSIARNKKLREEQTKKSISLSIITAVIAVCLVVVAVPAYLLLKPAQVTTTIEEEQVADEPKSVDPEPVEPNADDPIVPANKTLDASETGLAIVYLTSSPEGAEVTWRGKTLGVTPLTFEGLPAGEQSFTFARQYHIPADVTLALTDNQLVKHEQQLSRGTGSLTILSTPAEATVLIAGKAQASQTPLAIDAIQAGEYSVLIKKDDALYETTIAVEHGESKVVRAALTKGELIAYGEQWLSAQELFTAAKQDVAQGRLVLPLKESALSKYRVLLDADEQSAVLAQAEIDRIVTGLTKAIEAQISGQKFSDAQKMLNFVSENIPEFTSVTALQQKIDAAVAALQAEKKEQQYSQAYDAVIALINERDFTQASSAIKALAAAFPGDARTAELTEQLAQAELDYYNQVTKYSGEFITVPARSITLDSGVNVTTGEYNLNKAEITFAQWDACVDDGACTYRPEDEGWGRSSRPVVNVSFEDIQAQFIPWLARKTGFQYRLPTELEWEAATATDNKFYWGAAPVSGVANGSQVFGWPADNFDDLTAPTGSFPENPLGLVDIHGNVSEWTTSCWAEERAAKSNQVSTSDCNRFVVKGGSWRSGAKFLEVKQRQQAQKFQRANDRGFRLVRLP